MSGSMLIKCQPRYSIRRRLYHLLQFVILIICFCLFFQLKSHFIIFPSELNFNSVTTYPHILFDKTILNCSGDPLQQWCKNQVNLCNSSLIIFNKLFAITRSVILQPKFAKGKRLGGEDIQEVLNQKENDEYFTFNKEFIQLPCDSSVPGDISPTSHLSNVISSIVSYQTHPNIHLISETTIAVRRQDYANVYHTITDLYTVYLLCRFFQRDPKTVRILFLDSHPKGNLDIFWSQLFHSYNRLGRLKFPSILYTELIWSPPQPKSELDINQKRRNEPSFFRDFHQHVLKQFNVKSRIHEKLDCKSVNIFFLLRRNYVAHPRNPSGKISRQLTNEKQITDDLKVKFSNYSTINFTFNYFDQLTIEEQLNVVTQTDIFVGMHGAGLTHVLFMKSSRALIELVSPAWQSQIHFELMASINSINYNRCLIVDGISTTAQTIFHCIRSTLFQICPSFNSLINTTQIVKTISPITGNMSNHRQEKP